MDIQSAKDVIKAAAMVNDTVLMEGVHGIGKSEIVKQFADENGYHLEVLFLSQQETGDLIGIPHIIENENSSITTWSVPIWLQRMYQANAKGKPVICFLDELNRAPIDIRNAALQLVLERQIHEHHLPELNGQKTLIVAAINPTDEYQVEELDPALIDRFLHINVDVDAPAWLDWARDNNINKIIRDFIAQHSDRLHWTPADNTVGATPRSWAMLSRFMDNIGSIKPDTLFNIIKGKLGREIGTQFYSYWKDHANMLSIDDIIKEIHQTKSKVKTIEEHSEVVSELMKDAEVIQKTEMLHQFIKRYINEDDMYPLMVYLYSLEVEILAGFMKPYKETNPNEYDKIAETDNANSKELFKRIVKSALKVR